MDWELAKIFAVVYLPTIILLFVIIPLALIGTPENFEVNLEYINGILTASSILFGFWATILGRQPKGRVDNHLYKYAIGKSILVNIVLLIISVFIIFFSAMNKISSIFALIFVVTSFFFNVWTLGIHLYYHFKTK